MGAMPLELSEEFDPRIPVILPHEKIYSIQVGTKEFRLSGASLSSDAPSYFTAFFLNPENENKILFIDRSPQVFEKIYYHLQGYHVTCEEAHEYYYIWLDAFYFGLKRLQQFLLTEDTYAVVGSKSFKIPRVLFTRSNNYPNYFSISFDSLLTDNKNIISSKSMIRPPPQRPVTAANRSPQLFEDLLELLAGNNTVVKDDVHRELLIKECKYYRFKELEQRLVKHKIVDNPFVGPEIILNLFDLQTKGFVKGPGNYDSETPLKYTRPFITREQPRSLLIQIDRAPGCQCKLVLNRTSQISLLVCTGKIANQLSGVLKSVASDFTVELQREIHGKPLEKFVILCGLADAKTVMNGMELKDDWFFQCYKQGGDEPEQKRRKKEYDELVEFSLKRSIWRVYLLGDHGRFHAVSLEGETDQSFFNKTLDFL